MLSQLSFGDYLNECSYAAAVQASQHPELPRPSDLGTKYKAGDFDILLIYGRHGILVGELKSVGRNPPGVSRTPAQANDGVAERMGKAVDLLDKSETVVKHQVSDIAASVTVRKTDFLPLTVRKTLFVPLTVGKTLFLLLTVRKTDFLLLTVRKTLFVPLTVGKTDFLPHVSSTQLQQVLTADPPLEQVRVHTQ